MTKKSRTISIRITEEQVSVLQKEAEAAGFANTSEYIRNKIIEETITSKEKDEKPQNLNYGVCMKAEKNLVNILHALDKLPKKVNKESIEKEVRELWLLLNR